MSVLVQARITKHATIEVPDYLLRAAGQYCNRQDGRDREDIEEFIRAAMLSQDATAYVQYSYLQEPAGKLRFERMDGGGG